MRSSSSRRRSDKARRRSVLRSDIEVLSHASGNVGEAGNVALRGVEHRQWRQRCRRSSATFLRRRPSAPCSSERRQKQMRVIQGPSRATSNVFGQRKINAERLDTATHDPILNQMVYYPRPNLDRTFAALADPTRRALLARLGEEESLSVSELAKPFSMSLPAVMKHLDVLSDAGLVGREKSGRIVSCRLRAEPMRDANDWLNRYQKFWTERLDQLAAFLEEDTWPPPSQSNPASPSSAGSTRRRKKSSRHGRIRKK
ncbi:MAG TPA: metalloregulator ArsR/SmtB family transcription factor [Pseudolabrys sp.]